MFAFADSPLRIILLFFFLLLIGLVTGRITESEPLIKGSGIPLAGVFGHVLPEVLGGGHHIIDGLCGDGMVVGTMLLLLVGKFVFTMICFCSGVPGGIFFSLLVLGALTGGVIGSGACALLGLPESCMLNFLLLGMAGMFSGIVRAPVTGIILVAEMSGSLTQVTGLVLVSL